MATTSDKPLILTKEMEVKKPVSKFDAGVSENLSITFNEVTNELTLHVNNVEYKKVTVKDKLIGKMNFHDALQSVTHKFIMWRN